MKCNTGRVLLLSISLLMVACAAKKITNTACWVNQAKVSTKYKNIYIIGMLKNADNNISVESEMATMAAQRGIITTRNYDVQPANEIPFEMRRELAITKIKEYACDAICTISVKNINVESHYSGGMSVGISGYVPYNNYGNVYNDFNSYYANYYGATGQAYGHYASQTIVSSGKVKTEKTYFLECNLFEASTQQLLFSIQSEAINPVNIEQASKDYCAAIFKTLEENNVIGKNKGK